MGSYRPSKAWLIKKILTIGKVSLLLQLVMIFPCAYSRELIRHRFLIASMLACILTGCGDPNRSKIIGSWEIEQADTVMKRIQPRIQKPLNVMANLAPKPVLPR